MKLIEPLNPDSESVADAIIQSEIISVLFFCTIRIIVGYFLMLQFGNCIAESARQLGARSPFLRELHSPHRYQPQPKFCWCGQTLNFA